MPSSSKMISISRLIVLLILFIDVVFTAYNRHEGSSDSISITANGWRPIISSQSQYQTAEPSSQIYAPSSAGPPPVKAQNNYSPTPQSVNVTPKNQITNAVFPSASNQQHISHHSQPSSPSKSRPNKHYEVMNAPLNFGKIFGSNQEIILHGNHGSLRNHATILPLGYKPLHLTTTKTVIHSGSNRHPVMSKLQAHMSLGNKRHKPPSVIHLPGSATTRDEVFLSPPSSVMGSFPYFHAGNTKGSPPNHHAASSNNGKHYILPGAFSNSHIEFPNHFATAVSQDDFFQLFQNTPAPIHHPPHISHMQPHFVLPKHPFQNEITNSNFLQYKQQNMDEFTRNLVPPPFKSNFDNSEKRPEKTHKTKATTIESVAYTPATINDNPQIILGKQKNKQNKNEVKPPEKLMSQVPSPHHSEHFESKKKKPNQNVELEITKENFNVFHNQIPSNYNPHPEVQSFFTSEAQVTPPKSHLFAGHTYEVTEGKYDETTPKSRFQKPNAADQFLNQLQQSDINKDLTFLPTPYRPEVNPTISTPDVQTHYSHFNQYNQYSPYQELPHNNNDYPYRFSTPGSQNHEVTTVAEFEFPQLPTGNPANYVYNVQPETTVAPIEKRPGRQRSSTTTEAPSTTTKNYQRQRNQNRRRRPTKPSVSSTTPTYEPSSTVPASPSSTTSDIFSRPTRPKVAKPYATTSPAPYSDLESITPSLQPTINPTASLQNYYTPDYSDDKLLQKHRQRPSDFIDDFEDTEYQKPKYGEYEDTQQYRNPYLIQRPEENIYESQPNQGFYPEVQHYENYESSKDISQIDDNNMYTSPQRYVKTTTYAPPTNEVVTVNYDITKIPENEIENNAPPIREPPKEVFHVTTVASELATPHSELELSKTTVATTSAAKTVDRSRAKPNRFDANRPRFSVKEYRQRMQSSTTESTPTGSSTTGPSRLRYPARMRPSFDNDETKNKEDTRKFIPKENRYRSSTENSVAETSTTTEKPYRSNRLRPTGNKYNNRLRSTTSTTETSFTAGVPPPKVVIKPNTIFSNLKRPPPISLRTRILNKQRAAANSTTSTTENPATETEVTNFDFTKTENSDITQTTLATSSSPTLSPSRGSSTFNDWDMKSEESKFSLEELFDRKTTKESDKTTDDVEEEENTSNTSSNLHSQRVADLTSLSASNDYSTVGMFKTVSPNSRRIPNYFTLATEDPILPIEAFFPQLTHKDSKSTNSK